MLAEMVWAGPRLLRSRQEDEDESGVVLGVLSGLWDGVMVLEGSGAVESDGARGRDAAASGVDQSRGQTKEMVQVCSCRYRSRHEG